MNRESLRCAYRARDIARLYRNLEFTFVCIEKKQYDTAVMLYYYAKAYDPEDNAPGNELEYRCS